MLAEVKAVVNPVQVPLSTLIFKVPSFMAITLAVKMTLSVAPPIVNLPLIVASSPKAVLIFPATALALSEATPAVVSAEVGAAVMPTQVPSATAIFKVASFATFVIDVRIILSVAPLIVNLAITSASSPSAVLILPAIALASSDKATATGIVLGDPVIPFAVTTTLAFPSVVIVPTTVAVST